VPFSFERRKPAGDRQAATSQEKLRTFFKLSTCRTAISKLRVLCWFRHRVPLERGSKTHHYFRGTSLCGPELKYIIIRTTIISVIASFVVFGAWIINEVSYHPAAGPNPLAPLSSNVD